MIELVLIVLFTKWVVKAFMSCMLIRIQSSYETRKKIDHPYQSGRLIKSLIIVRLVKPSLSLLLLSYYWLLLPLLLDWLQQGLLPFPGQFEHLLRPRPWRHRLLLRVAIAYVGLYRNMQNLVDIHALSLLRQVMEEIIFWAFPFIWVID